MREIKFRAWDNHKQQWLRSSDNVYTSPNVRGIYNLKTKDGVPIILMQYTGLRDKNGAEIYEGDIVRGNTQHGVRNCVIEFLRGKFYPSGYEDDEYPDMPDWVYPFGFDGKGTPVLDGWEVIGNIYESPELLK